MRPPFLFLLLLGALAVPAPAGAATLPAFEWAMPARLGEDHDGDGLIDYAGSAADFEQHESSGPSFLVELSVRPDLCRRGATYTWRSTAGETTEADAAGCRITQSFRAEGNHPVELTIRGPGGKSRTFHREVAVRDWLIVSIGDSVASGEGNPEAPGKDGKKARWQSARCHRSAKAGPAQAAIALEKGDPQTTTTFVHLACSGAKVTKGLLGEYRGLDVSWLSNPPPLAPQVTELERINRRRHVDAVLLSIGANDIYFGPIVKFCLFRRNCIERRFNPKDDQNPAPFPRERLPQVVAKALDRLEVSYSALAARLAGVVPSDRVLITDYFDPTRDQEGRFCERIGSELPFGAAQIDQREAEWAATQLLGPLNQRIAKAAADHGWTGVTGVAEAFRDHGYCAKEPWVVHFKESWFTQKGDSLFSRAAGFLHPNEAGHVQEGAMLKDALAEVLRGEAPPSPETVVVLATGAEAEEDPEQTAGETDMEQAAAIALGGGIVAAAIAAGGVAARRRRPRDQAAEPRETEDQLPPLLPPERWPPGNVAAYGELLESSNEWVHRRVESIEIVTERLVRRRVSVDFTPQLRKWQERQSAPVPTHAPIALIAKKVLSGFDLRDEGGASVPMATSEENAAFAAAHMLELAEDALGTAPSEELRRLCWTIARGEPREAQAALRKIATEAEPRLRDDERFRAVTATLAENFAVIVKVDDPSRRRVLKLAYDHVVNGELKLWQRLGLAPVLLSFWITELGDAASRHLEFVRAEGLDILSAQLIWRQPDGRFRGMVGARDGDEAHLRIDRKARGTKALAGVRVRASRSGLLVGGPWLAALSAAALTAAWFSLPNLAEDASGGAPSILLSIPAVLGAYLGARRPHPLEAALLWGARTLVFASGALAFVGAGALALEPGVEVLRAILGAAALLSWAAAAGLTAMYLQSPSRPPDDRGRVA